MVTRSRANVLLLLMAGLPLARPLAAEEPRSPKPSKPAAKKAEVKPVDLTPKTGIQTPGTLIAFSRLKAEAEIPGSPTWVLASDTLLIPAPSGEALEKIDLKTNKPGEPITGFSKPCAGAVSAFKSIWVANCGNGTIVRMEPKSNKVEATLNTGVAALRYGLAATADSVWVLADGKTTLSRIDPESNAIVGEVRLPAGCGNLQFGEASLWVTCPAEDKLLRINPMTNLVEQRIKVAATPNSLAFGDGSVWVLGLKEGKVDRIDPKTNKVTKTIDLKVPGAEGSIAFGEGALWASLTGFPLTRIDTTAEKEIVLQQFWGEGGGLIHTAAGSVWLSNTKQSTLLRLDPKRIIATLAE
jgi:virginiamycin B lyase